MTRGLYWLRNSLICVPAELQCFSITCRTLRYMKDYFQSEIGAASSWTSYFMTDCSAELRMAPLSELFNYNLHLVHKHGMNHQHDCFLSLFFQSQPLDHVGYPLVMVGETPTRCQGRFPPAPPGHSRRFAPQVVVP